MPLQTVTLFKPYEFGIGQKIRIEGGPRSGDWEVIGVTDRKVRLKCPFSLREFEWDRFCYEVQERKNALWPQPD